jgi:hypothetical protein
VPVTLVLERGGRLEVALEVLAAGARGPAAAQPGGAQQGHTPRIDAINGRRCPSTSPFRTPRLRARGHAVRDELLAHTLPLTWEHIGFSGDFLWGRARPP